MWIDTFGLYQIFRFLRIWPQPFPAIDKVTINIKTKLKIAIEGVVLLHHSMLSDRA